MSKYFSYIFQQCFAADPEHIKCELWFLIPLSGVFNFITTANTVKCNAMTLFT